MEENMKVDVVEELAQAAEDAGLEVTRMEPIADVKGDSGYGAIMVGAALGLGIVGGGYAIYKGAKAGVTWIGSKVKELAEKRKGDDEDQDDGVHRAKIKRTKIKCVNDDEVIDQDK